MAAVVGNLMKAVGNITAGIARLPIAAKGSPSFILKTQLNIQELTPLVTTVRHRYYSEKLAKGPLRKNYGYEDKLLTKGLMPHVGTDGGAGRLPIPVYKPKNSWAEKRAQKGQNDYIDILGDGSLRPGDICYTVPYWLRGFKGNEYQMLLRKRKLFGEHMRKYRPTKYTQMNIRIQYLYRFLNRKTKDLYWHKH